MWWGGGTEQRVHLRRSIRSPLKHEIIPANRGVCGIAYEQEDILQDLEAIEAAKALGERMKELGEVLGYS